LWSRILFFLLCTGCSVNPLYDGDSQSGEAQNFELDIIAEREGQKLRGYIMDSLRDLSFSGKRYRLTIQLARSETPFAFTTDGNARRLRISYTANVTLKNEKREVIFSRPISVHTSSNISSAQGGVVLSLYGHNNSALLRELSNRIIENIKVFLTHED
jgi:hypothetical protein